MTPAAVISDVCNTLFTTNTTFGFITYALSRQARAGRSLLLCLLKNRLSPLNTSVILLNRLTGRDWFKRLGVHLLRGFCRKELADFADNYLAENLLKQCIPETLEALLGYKSAGHRIILASSSLEPIVAAVAAHFGFEHVASQMEFSGEVATGRLLEDLTGIKGRALRRLGICPPYEVVISDDLSDRELLMEAREKVIVVYSVEAEKKWNVSGARIIRI